MSEYVKGKIIVSFKKGVDGEKVVRDLGYDVIRVMPFLSVHVAVRVQAGMELVAIELFNKRDDVEVAELEKIEQLGPRR